MEKKTIGSFLAALRRANGMTQQELADRLHISNKAVSRWERDECAPDLSLIPVLAEIFGVTCDELLKGERIFTEPKQERSEPKVERQLKMLIHRAISHFQTWIWISLALSVVGLVCMLGISYGFYRPVIGFAVMMLFAVASFSVALIGVGKMKEVKRENELFEQADTALQEKYFAALGLLSYVAYFAVFSVISLSLPLLLFRSDYVVSVLNFESYLFFAGLVALALLLAFWVFRETYVAWMTEQPRVKAIRSVSSRRHKMNRLQLGAVVLAGAIFLLYPYVETPYHTWVNNVCYLIALLFLVADAFVFLVCVWKWKKNRRELVLPGVRNLLLILPATLLRRAHYAVFIHIGESYVGSTLVKTLYQRSDSWQTGYIWYAIGLTLLIFVGFRLFENARLKKEGK